MIGVRRTQGKREMRITITLWLLALLTACSGFRDSAQLVSYLNVEAEAKAKRIDDRRVEALIEKRRQEQADRDAGRKRMDELMSAKWATEMDKVEAKRLADIAALDSTDKIKALLVANTISIGMTEKEFTLSNTSWKLSAETLMEGSVFRHWEEGGGRSVMTHNYRIAQITQ